ncbi:MAG: response regulator, partial [Acidobacteria bacterium]|nr:response regulator [Acidobacteriota bacterium]
MPHTLLLADDSATIQRVVELTFASEDIDVVTVGDGTKAIEAIERGEPDIVLADVSMPGRDGYEVASFVRRDPARDRIPVVLLTGAFEPLDESRCDAIGRHEVLVKPFEPRQVVGKVRELLDLPPK